MKSRRDYNAHPVIWVLLALLAFGLSGCGYVRLAVNEVATAFGRGQDRKSVNIYGDTEVVASLDDPRFNHRLAEQGLYEPKKFRESVGPSLFTIEGDLSKTPVVFVHGIKGHPGDWSYVVERLDRERFHPWFFYYPTGERLDLAAEALYHSLENLSAHGRIYIVAHSMGGLVAKAAIDRYGHGGNDDHIRLFVTFNTGYGGIDTAATAVRDLPVVVPSWRDIATGSPFVEHLAANPLPLHVEFHLFFSFMNGHVNLSGPTDGVIPLVSQLEPRMQARAVRMYGYVETHAGILVNPDAVRTLMEILESAGR